MRSTPMRQYPPTKSQLWVDLCLYKTVKSSSKQKPSIPCLYYLKAQTVNRNITTEF